MTDGKQLTLIDCEHMFWLAARDVIFFTTYNSESKGWDDYWRPVVICSDTFYYACADAEDMEISDLAEIRRIYEEYGWAGPVAWIALKRGEMPLVQLQDDEFKRAYKDLSELKS